MKVTNGATILSRAQTLPVKGWAPNASQHDDQMASELRLRLEQREPKMTSMPSSISALPWLIALIGLAVPLVGGSGAGWPYVVGWLVVLGVLLVVKPLRLADHRDRIQWALIAAVLLVAPGLVVGGLYLLPAALLWLAIELRVRSGPSAIS